MNVGVFVPPEPEFQFPTLMPFFACVPYGPIKTWKVSFAGKFFVSMVTFTFRCTLLIKNVGILAGGLGEGFGAVVLVETQIF